MAVTGLPAWLPRPRSNTISSTDVPSGKMKSSILKFSPPTTRLRVVVSLSHCTYRTAADRA